MTARSETADSRTSDPDAGTLEPGGFDAAGFHADAGHAASHCTASVPRPAAAVPAAAPAAGDAARRSAILVRAIEERIVPRLALARTDERAGPQPAVDPAERPGLDDVRALVGLLLADDIAAAAGHVEEVRRRGIALERIYLDLFAPAARQLGRMWEDDRASFAEVTIGLARLQHLLHEFSPAFTRARERLPAARRALLTPVPGEQHVFGHAMVCEFFRRAGWNVAGEPMTSSAALCDALAAEWFGVLGISIACADRLPELAALIRAARRAACNPQLGVLVGGRVFANRPELVVQVGADATASDADQAPLRAESMLQMLAVRN